MLYKRGKKGIWYYSFEFGGKRIHESSKSTSKTVAREAERARRRQLEQSWNQITRRTLPPSFERAANDWYEAAKPHIAERTKAIYGDAVRLHLKPALGSILLCDIDATRIASYQARRKAEEASARTLNKELQVLRMILKRYKLWANLQGDMKFEREQDEVGQALSREDEARLLESCASNPLLHTVVTLALNTALRKSEIRLLRWNQVDLFKRSLTVGKSKTAGGTGRPIPLNAPAYAALVKWAGRFPESKAEDYVFPACEDARIDTQHPGKSNIDPSRPIKSWRTAWRTATRTIECPKCGKRQHPAASCRNPECKTDISSLKNPLAGLRFHDLRHTCITKLAEGQASEQTIMAIAGHVSRKMLEHYSHIRMEAKRAALDAIAQAPNPVSFGAGSHQNPHQVPGSENREVANSMN
ncbi:MAG: site-specific integrase [Acidobacteriia bacterium]|nr:site-specific integrase [Terriglobia bacterium]